MQHTTIKAGLLLGVAATGLAVATPVLAQSNDSSGASDIIVTAQRIEQRLQDVPISITVYNQEQLSNRNVVTATDLATYTPSLSVNQRFGPEKASFAIRGFQQENNTSPSVGVYFADVEFGRAAGGTTSGGTAVIGSFMDLQNVQVLKGPQGTLFGRNTTGGAVLLVPNRPTDRLEGWVEGSAGNFNMWRGQAVLNVPLADTFKVRLAVDRQKRDGYMINHSGIGPRDYNDINYFAGRLSILADLTPDLENYTIATYSHSFSHGYGARVVSCNPTTTMPVGTPNTGVTGFAAVSPVTQITAFAACDQIRRQNARGDGPLDVDIDNHDPYLQLHHWEVINTTTWRASDGLTIKNTASYQEITERSSFSLNGDNFFVSNPAPSLAGIGIPIPLTPGTKFQYILLNPPNATGDQSTQSAFTEEFQLQGNADRLTWQAGAYLSISRPLGWSSGRTGILLDCISPQDLLCTNPLLVGSMSQSKTKSSFTTVGLYAQGTYNLTDQLSLTGGFRYTWDTTKVSAENTRLTPPSLIAPTTVLRCNDPVHFPATGAGARPGQAALASTVQQCHLNYPTAKSQKPTWLIDVDYKPTNDILLYAKYARGYRQGGINPTNVGLETWLPEKVDSFEVGAKASWRGSFPGYFNLAGFYNNFSNQQLPANATAIPGSGFGGAQPIVNAGKSKLKGIEADGSVTLFQALRLDAGYTYLRTRLESFNAPPIPAGAPYDALITTAKLGGELALSPRHRLSITGTYTLPLDELVGKVSVGSTYTYTSSQFFNRADTIWVGYPLLNANIPLQRDLGQLPATHYLNVNANWDKVLGTPFDVAFFMTNVTNKKYPVGVGSSLTSAGFENMVYAAPRMWGFRLRYSFGE